MVTARLATTSFMNLQRPLTNAGHAQEAQIPPSTVASPFCVFKNVHNHLPKLQAEGAHLKKNTL
jgi:hypothetical protein